MTSRTTIGAGALTAALAAAALTFAACGSSSGGGGGTTSAAAATNAAGAPSAADRTRLTACLKQHGVELPERPAGPPGAAGGDGAPPPQGVTTPGGAPPAGATNPGGTPPQGGSPPGPGGAFGRDLTDAERKRMQAAFTACGARGMMGGPGQGRPGGAADGAPSAATLKRYVACVRRNGYDLPDPNTSGSGSVFDPGEVDRDDPAFVKASSACERLLRASG
jgi:hypothetical protein